MIFFYYVVPFLVAMSLLVFIHELGHYFVAVKHGVRVDVFSIGMGPELFGHTDSRGTRWKFSLFPIGGYVMFFGDKDIVSTMDAESCAKISKEEYKKCLIGKSPLQRIAISIAGPVANIVGALALLVIVYSVWGKPLPSNEISRIADSSVVKSFNVSAGDKIISIGGVILDNQNALSDVTDSVLKLENATRVEIVFQSGETTISENLEIDVTNPLNINLNKKYKREDVLAEFAGRLKIEFKKYYYKTGILSAFNDTVTLCVDCATKIFSLICGQSSMKGLGGFVAIAGAFGNLSMQKDLAYLMFFSAVLSINLGIINLVPFPALDGGAIMVDCFELIFRRPLSIRVREWIGGVGFGLLLLLMIVLAFNDLLRLGLFKMFVW